MTYTRVGLVLLFVAAAGLLGYRLWRRRSVAAGKQWTRGDIFDAVGVLIAGISLLASLSVSDGEAASLESRGVQFQISGQASRWLDLNVPAGQPPIDANRASDDTDVELNLDGTLVAAKATEGAAISPLGHDRPPSRPCSEATGWTGGSVDVETTPYFCLRTSDDRYVLFHLEDFVQSERSPRATFRVYPG